MLDSIFSQASYLSNNLEKHLLGNHYFANLKALLLLASFLKKAMVQIAIRDYCQKYRNKF